MREIAPHIRFCWVLAVALMVCAGDVVRAQNIRWPTPPATSGQPPMIPVQPYGGGMGAPAMGNPTFGGATLGAPVFDPYATTNAPAVFGAPVNTPYGTVPAPASSPGFGGLFGGQPSQPLYAPPGSPAFGQPVPRPWANMPPASNTPAPWFGNPPPSNPYGAPPANNPFQQPNWNPFGQPQASPWGNPYPGSNPYPGQSPNSLFPDGFNWGNGGYGEEPLRLFQNLRLRHTWLDGSEGREMDIHDTEIGTTVQLPNTLGLGQPLMISPIFMLHQWDGPQPPSLIEMPPRAYSALLEAAYKTDPTRSFGADLTASIGVFSDFSAVTARSIRIQGLGYVWTQLTPTAKLKLGANYIDRVDLSLLPAVGILWEPDQQTKLDIFFPKPKLARYFTTLGNTDIWIYFAGEYGGGSWTVKHNGASDQVDINDIRAMIGFDWISQSGWQGMFEVGWVTARELVFYHAPADNLRLRDTFMLRAGLTY